MELRVTLFVVLAVLSQTEAQDLQVSLDNSETKQVTVGEQLKLVCKVNRGLMFVIENYVEIVHQPLDGPEVILAVSGKLTNGDPNFYNLEIAQKEDSFTLEFLVKTVRDVDEGFLICRVRPGKSNDEGEAKVEIVILRPLDSVHLAFDDLDPISRNVNDPIEIDAGEHTLTCSAEGSNPAPTAVNLYLHDNEVTDIQQQTDKIDGNVRKYRTTITARVHLTVANTHQEIKCVAKAQIGDDHSVKLPIKIKVYDPKIECNDSEAYPGKMYPILTCTVDYEGLNIKSFKYELDQHNTVEEGQQNNEFVEVKREQLSETKARVHLHLYQAKEWHFDRKFFLVVENADGHKTREAVRLHEIPGIETEEDAEKGPGNSSNMVTSSMAALMFALFAFLMSL